MSSGIFNKHTGFHNRRSIRLPDYDYSKSGAYFFTLCVQNMKEPLFGRIAEQELILNRQGIIAQKCWLDIPIHFPNVNMDEFVIMPDHIHGIIIIGNFVGARLSRPLDEGLSRPNNADFSCPISKNDHNHTIGRDNRAPTLGKIIAYFKYQSTKQINNESNRDVDKIWQRNYHDHIIRNDHELNAIRQYIQNNPLQWNLDDENPDKPNFLSPLGFVWAGYHPTPT